MAKRKEDEIEKILTEEEYDEIEDTANDIIEEKEEEIEEKVDVEKELNDKYLRLFAEFENFKKRTQKEKIQIYTDAAADVVEAILPTIDNLQRAIASEENDSPMKDGVIMILKQLEESLASIGVEPINAVGEQFNPELHNAVMHIDDENYGDNTVIEEFAKGYKYRDKVIRHSVVRVAN